MYKIQRVLMLIFAAVTCLASTNCRHVKKNRSMKLDICQACTELLNETVTKALEDIKLFSKCIEDNCDSAPILDGSARKIKAKDEMFSSLPTFIHQIKIIQNAWEQHKLPSCPQNLEKYLTRILCLSRGASKKQKSCLARDRVKGPKADSGATIDYTGNYIRKVYSTLNSFVINLR